MTNKRRIEQVTTPVGIAAGFPKIKVADTKFVADGVYTAQVILTPDQFGGLKKKIDDAVEGVFGEQKKKLMSGDGKSKNKAKELTAFYPYEPEYDDEGDETGNLIFKSKMNAHVKTSTGKEWDQRPSVWDAQGNELKGSAIPEVWNGSHIALSVGLNGFYKADTNQAGISLRLYAVQVVKLVSAGGGSAESHGFGTYEEGFTADTSPFEDDQAGGGNTPCDEGEDF